MARPRTLPCMHTCERCSAQFEDYPSAGRRFCTVSCKMKFQRERGDKLGGQRVHEVMTKACEHCGVEVPQAYITKRGISRGRDRGIRFCSKSCANRSRGPAKGHFDKHGYHVITVDGRQVYEHRVVMERLLGRPLTKEETVHHKDGNRAHNEPINLELWSSRHGKGQRVEDKIEFAKALLAEYGYVVTTTDQSIEVLLKNRSVA